MPSIHLLRLAGQRSLRLTQILPGPASKQMLHAFPCCYSTVSQVAVAGPLFLQKLKGDLKSAMRAKDVPRLAVLRAIMAANLNASKTANPVETDAQFVALVRKIKNNAQDAASEAQAAGRKDLVEKEMRQVRILNAYLADSGVTSLGQAELKSLVQEAIDTARSRGSAAKALMGDVMKSLARSLEGKDVDKKHVADLVRDLIK